MTIPKEDLLPLHRALRALEDAKKSLKEFSQKWSVAENDAFAERIMLARDLVEKARKCCGSMADAAARLPPMDSIENGFGEQAAIVGRVIRITVSNSVLTAMLWQKMRRCPDCPRGGIPIAIVTVGRSGWEAAYLASRGSFASTLRQTGCGS